MSLFISMIYRAFLIRNKSSRTIIEDALLSDCLFLNKIDAKYMSQLIEILEWRRKYRLILKCNYYEVV